MCSDVMVQHCPRPLAPASAELYFQSDQHEPSDLKGPEHILSDIRGNGLRPPHGRAPAAEKTNQALNEDSLEARNT